MNWFRKKIKTKAEDLSSRKNGEGISILAVVSTMLQELSTGQLDAVPSVWSFKPQFKRFQLRSMCKQERQIGFSMSLRQK